MSRLLDTTIPVGGDVIDVAEDRFTGSPDIWLADDVRPHGASWQGEVRVGRLRRPVHVDVGAPWLRGQTVSRAIAWTPVRRVEGDGTVTDGRLPAFTGQISLRRDPTGAAWLRLVGTYDPPGGAVGNALDALLLHKVAEVTASQMLGDIEGRLTAPADEPVLAAP
ncbi:hypothetical protein [Euzebya sp.]|uniref:hypothetical protein n=1 Tax=Euzebya sp. TaxID=1971409 RepID=UPI0035197F84